MAAAAATVLLLATLRERRDAPALAFAALVLVFGLWALGRALEDTTPVGAMLATGALALLGTLLPVTASLLRGAPRFNPLYLHSLWVVPLAAGASLGSGHMPSDAARPAMAVWALIGLAAGARTLGRAALGTDEATPDATRLRYLTATQVAVLAAFAVDLAAWSLGRPRIATLIAGLLFLYGGYLHVARMRVRDLHQLMGNAVALTVMALGLAGSFTALWVWVGHRMDVFLFNAFVGSFVLLLFLEPMRAWVQQAMDRRFIAAKLELERAFRPLAERLPHILTLDDFLREAIETTEASGRIRASSIFLREDPHVGFQQVASFGLPPRRRVNLISTPAWVRALEADRVLLREEIEADRAQPRSPTHAARLDALLRTMDDLDAQLVLPLRTDASLVGFWTLTDLSDTEPFSSNEIGVLRQIAQQMGVTIENSKTFERVRARDHLAALGEMSAGLAHEIRNPLAAIRGSISLLEDPGDADPEEIRRVIVEEIERLDRVVDSFLDYASPPEGGVRKLDLGELVQYTAAAVARRHAGSGVELALDIEPDLPPISANPDQLESVIGNILQNAYEALDGSGHIRLTLRRVADGSEEFVELLCVDDGPGMDADTLERAFFPFFTTKATGTGLGLALCERLVQAQGGTILLRSSPGEKTEVAVRLPCAEREVPRS
jgi:two-component system, NtrC family, sensor histidine kinase HydH